MLAGFVALLLAAYSAALYLVSSRPAVPGSLSLFPHADKVAHGGAYGIWGGLAFASLELLAHPRSRGARAFLAQLAAILYGTSDEVHQAFVPGRSSDGWDLVADSAGAFLAIALAALWCAWREKAQRRGARA